MTHPTPIAPVSAALGPWIDHTVSLVRAFNDDELSGAPEHYAEAATWIGLAAEVIWTRWRSQDDVRLPSWELLDPEELAIMVSKAPGFDPWRRARAFACVLAFVPWLERRGLLTRSRAADLVGEFRALLDAERPRPEGRAPAARPLRPASGACRRRMRRRLRTLRSRFGSWGAPRSSLRPTEG